MLPIIRCQKKNNIVNERLAEYYSYKIHTLLMQSSA